MAWTRLDTCPAGEALAAVGLTLIQGASLYPTISRPFYRAMCDNELDTCECVLDQAEDEALSLKRNLPSWLR